MAEEKKPIQQPTEAAERDLLDIIDSRKDVVTIGGHKYKIGPLKKGTRILISRIMLGVSAEPEDKDSQPSPEDMIKEDKVAAKCAAAYILNSWWKLYFLGGIVWKIYWRWLYYFRQYTDSDYLILFLACKKKADKQTNSYMMNIMLQTEMKITTMAMTRKEAKRTLQEKRSEQRGEQPKNSRS